MTLLTVALGNHCHKVLAGQLCDFLAMQIHRRALSQVTLLARLV
jgi:hypothetical protein